MWAQAKPKGKIRAAALLRAGQTLFPNRWTPIRRSSVTVRKQNASNYTAIALDSTKLVMDATASDATTYRSIANRGTMPFWPSWIGILTHSARRFKTTSTSKVATARSLAVKKNTANAIKQDLNAGKTANAKTARTCRWKRGFLTMSGGAVW